METKLSRLETADDKLMDEFDDSEAASEFQIALDEDSELMDNVINKVSQLKTLKEEIKRK